METSLASLLTALLPDLPPVQFDGCSQEEKTLTFWFQTTASPIACQQCGVHSRRVRSRYRRTVWDLPWADRGVRLCLRLRKFACLNLDCPRRIFPSISLLWLPTLDLPRDASPVRQASALLWEEKRERV